MGVMKLQVEVVTPFVDVQGGSLVSLREGGVVVEMD